METKLLSPTPAGIDEAGRLLADGQLVAIPTETVYGLAADALNADAVREIFNAKGRPADNPLIVHIADIKDWAPLVKDIPENAEKLAEAYWPGPLTMILPADDKVPSVTRGGLKTVAVRFPAHPVAQAVILRAGCPLAAPSANRSGAPSPTNARRVTEDMQGRIAAVLDGGDSAVGVESTVVDLSGDKVRLLRPGGITPEMLEAVVGDIEIDPACTRALEAGAIAASPGMKYKHYAPQASVTLVKGTPAAYAEFVNAHAGDGVFALCFEEDLPQVKVPAICYGKREDPLTQAHLVFDALRQLDEAGAVTVYAASPKPFGVGLAVYNRMIRAAAHRVVNTIRVIGLTGPTGAGKSTVADTWVNNGAYRVDADEAARKVTEPGSPCLAALAEAFSPAILFPDGSLDRRQLAKQAFASPEATEKLNAITHPAIMLWITRELENAADRGCAVAVLDAPLLFEAGADSLCDHIVAVTAPAASRQARICARDGITPAEAQKRMAAQHGEEYYARPGVTCLVNDGTPEELAQKAQALWDDRRNWWGAE